MNTSMYFFVIKLLKKHDWLFGVQYNEIHIRCKYCFFSSLLFFVLWMRELKLMLHFHCKCAFTYRNVGDKTITCSDVWKVSKYCIITYLKKCYFFLHLTFQHVLLHLKERKKICTFFFPNSEGSFFLPGLEYGIFGLLFPKIPEVRLREFSAENCCNKCGHPFWNRVYILRNWLVSIIFVKRDST